MYHGVLHFHGKKTYHKYRWHAFNPQFPPIGCLNANLQCRDANIASRNMLMNINIYQKQITSWHNSCTAICLESEPTTTTTIRTPTTPTTATEPTTTMTSMTSTITTPIRTSPTVFHTREVVSSTTQSTSTTAYHPAVVGGTVAGVGILLLTVVIVAIVFVRSVGIAVKIMMSWTALCMVHADWTITLFGTTQMSDDHNTLKFETYSRNASTCLNITDELSTYIQY